MTNVNRNYEDSRGVEYRRLFVNVGASQKWNESGVVTLHTFRHPWEASAPTLHIDIDTPLFKQSKISALDPLYLCS